jgi:DNA polymerase/3'-5' exonuclease PolX
MVEFEFKPGDLVEVTERTLGDGGGPPPILTGELAFVEQVRERSEQYVLRVGDKLARADIEGVRRPTCLQGSAKDEKRVPLDIARVFADDVLELLAPACERIEVAGSIRRGAADVGDVEIVCVPTLHFQTDLFGDLVETAHNQLDKLTAHLVDKGKLEYRLDKNARRAWGSRHMRAYLVARGALFPVDIFAVLPPATWGVIFAIRSGPAEFSKALVSQRDHGGALPAGWKVKDGQLLVGDGQLIDTPEEAHVFAALGLPWIPAGERSAESLRDAVRWAMRVPGA